MAKIKIKIGSLCSKSKIVQNNWFFAPIFLFALSSTIFLPNVASFIPPIGDEKHYFWNAVGIFKHFTENVEMPDLVDKGWFMPGMSFLLWPSSILKIFITPETNFNTFADTARAILAGRLWVGCINFILMIVTCKLILGLFEKKIAVIYAIFMSVNPMNMIFGFTFWG